MQTPVPSTDRTGAAADTQPSFLYGSMQVLEPLAIGVILIATNKKELTI